MKRVLLASSVLALAVAAPVAAQQKDNTVTITATPAQVVFGKATTIAGQVTGTSSAGATVELEASPAPFTGGYQKVAEVVADATGNYAFSVTPAVSTRYRTSVKIKGKTTSPEATVSVALKVTRRVSDKTPRRGQRVRFSGTVTPAHDGQVASLQRRTSDGWKTVKTTVLVAHTPVGTVARSKYSMRKKIGRTGTYRVHVASGDADHVDGTSRKRKLRTH